MRIISFFKLLNNLIAVQMRALASEVRGGEGGPGGRGIMHGNEIMHGG